MSVLHKAHQGARHTAHGAGTALLDDLRGRQAQLQERGELLQDLIYAFSHDLRTPLLALTDQLLLVAKYESGEAEDEPRSVDLREVTLGVISQLQERAGGTTCAARSRTCWKTPCASARRAARCG
ncbi:hypothetical protein [Deinococcus aerius]|uniref:hypothetical protein n=1 Tax=Deinococcus aerius TaxID=200253 RepID=UPI0013FE107F